MSEKQYLVLSAMGTDRPGIVAEVSDFLAARDGNIEDSRMATLGGEFGLMVLVSGHPEDLQVIQEEIGQLERQSRLRITVKPTTSPRAHRGPTLVTYHISAHAIDHEGIVHAITECLYSLEANIVSLETSTYHAPVTGTPLFHMELTVDVPQETSIARLRDELNEVARAENVDLEIRAV